MHLESAKKGVLPHDPIMNPSEYRVMFVTAPDLEVARLLAKGAVQNRLAACAKIFSGVESHYWWEDRLDCAEEYQLLFKTQLQQVPPLQKWIIEHHPYEVPECVTVPIDTGHPAYLEWIRSETEGEAPSNGATR